MTVRAAFTDGCRRTLGAPSVVSGLWAVTLLLALPMAWALRDQLAGHLAGSLAADTALTGVNLDWWNEFLAQASGIGLTFVPSILGFAAVLKNLSAMVEAEPVLPALVPVLVAHVLAMIFLTGGVLDRLARGRRIGSAGFFSACGVYFFRFLRLGVMAGVVYWVLFTTVHGWLFERAYDTLVHNLTSERTAFLARVLVSAAFGALVLLVNLVVDYAKIRMVVEDRRSAIGAVTSATRFVRRQPGAVIGLYAVNAGVFVALLAGYAMLAPGAATPSWMALLAGQTYIATRMAARVLFAASQIALFQGRLAHAGYVARPLPTWPESPAAAAVLADQPTDP